MLSLAIAAAMLAAAPGLSQLPAARIPEPRIEGGRLGAAYLPLIEEMRRGGLVLLFRHDRTEITGLWDYEPYEAGRCDRERRLSEAGQASARAIGQALRQMAIPVTRVIASTYCRAIESAAYMFGGAHEIVPDLIGPDGKGRDLAQVRREISTLIQRQSQPEGVLVLVGHHGTTDAFTTRMLDEGDALIIRPRARGEHQVLAHVPAARWEEIARDLDRQRFAPRPSRQR